MVRFGVSRLSRKLCVLAFLAVFTMFGAAALNPAHATSATDPACDSAFLQKLKDRAWAEAQRELMHNKQMVWKPDSVFALGCAGTWMQLIPKSFSQNGGSAVTNVSNHIGQYLSASFNHSFGGGNVSSGSNSNVNNCGNIGLLWNAALCQNLNTTQIQTFSEASGTDPRVKPTACSNTGGFWGNASSVITSAGAGAGFDAMSLFSSVVAPLSELSPQKCSKGIPTGVMLSGGTNKEIVCPNPGCTPTGGTSPQCCKTGTSSGTSCQ